MQKLRKSKNKLKERNKSKLVNRLRKKELKLKKETEKKLLKKKREKLNKEEKHNKTEGECKSREKLSKKKDKLKELSKIMKGKLVSKNKEAETLTHLTLVLRICMEQDQEEGLIKEVMVMLLQTSNSTLNQLLEHAGISNNISKAHLLHSRVMDMYNTVTEDAVALSCDITGLYLSLFIYSMNSS